MQDSIASSRIPPARWRRPWLALLAAPFILFAAYAARELFIAQNHALEAELNRAAAVTAHAVDLRLQTSVGYLTALATSDAALRDDIPALYAQALRVVQAMPEATAISLVDQGNELIFLTLKPLGTKGLAVGDRDAMQQVFHTGKPVVSKPFKSPIADRMVTSVAVPIFHDGVVRYGLRLILRTSTLNDILHAQKLPQDWTLAIFDGDGRIVARSRSPKTTNGKLATDAAQQALRAKNPLLVEYPTLDGVPSKGVFLSLPGWSWSVGVAVPMTYFQQQRNQMARWLGLLGLALLALGALALAWLSPSVLRALPGARDDAAHPLHGYRMPIFALLAIIGIGALLAWSIQAGLARQQERGDQTTAAMAQKVHLLQFLSLFKDLETWQRGYLITGKEEFLLPYAAATSALAGGVARLKAALHDIPLGPFNWGDFEEIVTQRQQLAADAIARRREIGDQVLDDASLLDRGRLAMDKLRVQVAVLEKLVDQRIALLTEAQAQERMRMRQILWLTSLANWVLVMLAIGLWLRERRQRLRLYTQLQDSHADLEQRVLQRTQQLQQAHGRLRRFASASEQRVEQERSRISREVHDQLGQIFTGVKMILGTLRPGSLEPEQQQALADALDMGVQTTRRIAAELRPPLLDDLGLSHALAHDLKKRFDPLGISFTLDMPDVQGLDERQSTQLFRVVQECCTNICRHAQARHVDVTSRTGGEGFSLYIDDDGKGFDEARVREGALGLIGIRERVHMMGGRVEFLRQPSGGTRVAVHLPLVRQDGKEEEP